MIAIAVWMAQKGHIDIPDDSRTILEDALGYDEIITGAARTTVTGFLSISL